MTIDPLTMAVYIVYAAWSLYLFYRFIKCFARLFSQPPAPTSTEAEEAPQKDWSYGEALRERFKDKLNHG